MPPCQTDPAGLALRRVLFGSAAMMERSYAAQAVLAQLTAGGNVWGAETLLLGVGDPAFRPALLLLRAGDAAGCAARMREMLAP